MNKPRLWLYKSGIKARHLRPSAKKYLSFKLKEYYQLKRINLKQKFERQQLITEQAIPLRRIRRQVVYNAESKGKNLNISIRILCINKNIDFKTMNNTLDEFLYSNPPLLNMPFFSKKGFEQEAIDDYEDKQLKDNRLYIELNIRGRITIEEWKD